MINTELYQDLLDEVWAEFRLESDTWDDRPDAAYLNELESVKFLAARIEELKLSPHEVFQVITTGYKFRLPEQSQMIIYGLSALPSADCELLATFFEIFIKDGLDFYMSYWICFNPNSPEDSVGHAARYAIETEDPELLELAIQNPNLKKRLRIKCERALESAY